ncbi:MAG: diguanylate cyclase [Thermodesulfobacteriota bacterium]
MHAEHVPSPSPWKRFAVNLTLVILLFISALFSGIYLNHEKTIEQGLKNRARALFSSIAITRKWNAMHGGIYVEKTPGMESNPYLKNPDIAGVDGRVYTKKNPALMTREISEIAEKEGAFQFHITSLRPLNPQNAPDAFERQALHSFSRGEREAIGRETVKGTTFYRYMAPLTTEKPCLACHAAQGYRLGDVRGGISIRFNIDEVERSIFLNRLLMALLFTITAVSFLGIVHRLILSLQRKLTAAEEKIRELAVTDELTGLRNRRYLLSRLADELDRAHRYHRPLAGILFDVDHFKRVNDTHGHDAGDAVLKAIGATALRHCRATDLVGRYGGEEFFMILPETDLDEACFLAERLRQTIADLRTAAGGREVAVTASFGVASYMPDQNTPLPDLYGFIKQADTAMYEAKKLGRNRVQPAGA